MREMEIPPFPRKFDNPDLGDFLRQRLSQTSVLWPEQAIPLVGRSADALITPSIDAIESRPPAENTAKKQRGSQGKWSGKASIAKLHRLSHRLWRI